MAKLRILIVVVVLLVLTGAIVQQKMEIKPLAAEAVVLRQQLEKIESLKEENRAMTARLEAATERAQADRNDLAQLRARAPEMAHTETENARLKAELKPIRQAEEQKAADNFDGNAALHWVTVSLMYASAHQGQFPASLEEVIPTLKDSFLSALAPKIIETTNRYELVYHGTLEGLTNPPPEAAIIIRATQARQNTNGTWTKEYGMGNGSGQFRSEPDGNFERFESGRIPKSGGK